MSGVCKRKGKAAECGVQKKASVPVTLGVCTAADSASKAADVQHTHYVNLYRENPKGEIDLKAFEMHAKNRRSVLQGIDAAQASGVLQKDMREHIEKLLRQHMPGPRNAAEVQEARAIDSMSHFILRLAYSRTAALRQWFVAQEEVLFRHRFNSAGYDVRMQCMDGLQAIGEDEFAGLAGELRAVFAWRQVAEETYFKDTKEQWQYIYKVPFEQVADLVRCRKVLMCGGWAYMLSTDAASVAATFFRQRLMRGLLVCSDQYYDTMHEEHERLAPLMHSLPENVSSAVFGSEASLALADLPAAMQASAPLCMRRTYGVLLDRHKLKYAGRNQFNLFLKSVGVSMENAMAFWRREFMKGGMTGEYFDKEYSYNVRHEYGQEGCRAKYAGYSCKIVIAAAHDRTGETGCPYRACQSSDLHSMLREMRVPDAAIVTAVDKAQNKHYQVACTGVFEALHKQGLGQPLTHPQQYFLKSQEIMHEKEPTALLSYQEQSAYASELL